MGFPCSPMVSQRRWSVQKTMTFGRSEEGGVIRDYLPLALSSYCGEIGGHPYEPRARSSAEHVLHGLQIAVPVFSIGLEVTAFGPFVPRVDGH